VKRNFKLVAAAALPCLALLTAAQSTRAAISLMSEDFTYADGPITTVSGGNWTLHSGTDAGTTALNVTSQQAVINQADLHGSGADVNRLFSGATTVDPATDNSTKLYASYTVNFSQLPLNGDSDGSYFSHFKSSAANEFYGRVGANTNGAASGMFRLAVANETWTIAGSIENPQDLALNTTYTVVERLDLATDQTTLWINPVDESSTSVTATDAITYAAGGLINAYALRQGTSGGATTGGAPGVFNVDGLRVGTTFADVVPEPAGLGVFAAAGLLLARRRK
jgi:hypothetical protein